MLIKNSRLLVALCLALWTISVEGSGFKQEDFTGTLDMGSLTCSGAPGNCFSGKGDERVAGQLIYSDLLAHCVPSSYLGIKVFEPATHRASFSDLSWVQFGIQHVNLDGILFTDQRLNPLENSSIVYVSAIEGLMKRVEVRDLDSGDYIKPSRLARTASGYIVEAPPGHISWLDEDFRLLEGVQISGAQNDSGKMIGSLYSWQALGDDIYIFGDISNVDDVASEEWFAGVSIVPKEKPNNFRVIDTVSRTSSTRNYSWLAYPILAKANDRVFVLKFEGDAAVYQITPTGLRRIYSWPGSKTQMPPLSGRPLADEIVGIYQSLERATMPVALYGQEDNLYVLERMPLRQSLEGKTSWWLTELDTITGRKLRQLSLPTNANHMVLIPGDKQWVVLEKGPVEAVGKQRVINLRAVVLDELQAVGSEPGNTQGVKSAKIKTEESYPKLSALLRRLEGGIPGPGL